MQNELLSLKKQLNTNQFRWFWMMIHVFLWGITQAISSTAKLSLHLFIANIINPFICSLEISENNWGSTCRILGLDIGLAAGQFVSLLVVFLIGGIVVGIGEWWLISSFFDVSSKWRTPLIILTIVIGLTTTLFVNFFAMFAGIVNAIIGGVNLSFAAFVVGFFLGGVIGIFYGIITLILHHQRKMNKNVV